MIIDSGVRLALSAYHDSGARQDIHRRSRDPVTRDQASPGDVASHVQAVAATESPQCRRRTVVLQVIYLIIFDEWR